MATASPAKAVPDWLRLQRKIFSRWTNQKLFLTRNIKVDDVVQALGDAPTLVALIEVLSEKKFEGRLEKAAKMRVHRIDNMNQALKFAKDIGVQTKVPPSAEAMVDGDEKSVLGFLWAILLKFLKIGDDSDETLNAKDALMMWAKNKTVGYANVSLENWTTSFQDGLALCAILHKHRPQLLDYASLSKENKKANLETAMNAAERYFGLEKYLTVEDFAKMDEISWVIYISDYYYGIAEARKIDLAARRIAKLIKFTIECDNLRATYRTKAGALVQTIARAKKLLEDRTIDDTMAGAKARIAAFYEYKEGDKSVIINDKLELEGVFNLLSLKLSHAKRPEFKPDAGQTLPDLEAHVRHLEECEKERSVALHAELNRQIRLLSLDREQNLPRFEQLQQWVAAKRAFLDERPAVDSVSGANLQLRLLEAYHLEASSVEADAFAQLQRERDELRAERYESLADVQQRVDAIQRGIHTELAQAAAAKKPVLDDHLARELYKQETRLLVRNHVERHANLQQWVREKEAYLQRAESIESINDAEVALSLLGSFQQDKRRTADSLVAALRELGAEILAREYRGLTQWKWETPEEIREREADIAAAFDQTLVQLADAKQQTLQAALAREQEKERLRLEFSHLANSFVSWTRDAAQATRITHFGFALDDVEAFGATLAAQDRELAQAADQRTATYTGVQSAMQQLGVVANPYTTLTVPQLADARAQLDQAVAARQQRYQAELAKQRENDALCRRFAEAANTFAEWIAATKERVSTSKLELEQQLAAVDALLGSVGADASRLRAAVDLSAQIQARNISHNKHTSLGQKDLEVAWAQYQSFLARKRQMIHEVIEVQRLRGLTAEQLTEIDVQFASFDKNGDKQLDRKELKACLYSLGEETPNSRLDQILAKWGSGGNSIQEAQFREFMIALLGDADTKDEVLAGFKLIARGNDHLPLDLAELVLTTHDVDYIKKTAPPAPVTNQLNFSAWTDDVYSR